MRWKPQQNDRMYRFVVDTGKVVFAALRLPVTVTGTENLPASGPPNGRSRRAVPGHGAAANYRTASTPASRTSRSARSPGPGGCLPTSAVTP